MCIGATSSSTIRIFQTISNRLCGRLDRSERKKEHQEHGFAFDSTTKGARSLGENLVYTQIAVHLSSTGWRANVDGSPAVITIDAKTVAHFFKRSIKFFLFYQYYHPGTFNMPSSSYQ